MSEPTVESGLTATDTQTVAAAENTPDVRAPRRRPRLRYLFAAVLLLVALLQLFVYTSRQGGHILEQQATLMARLLSNQSALAARRSLQDDDNSDRQALVDNLAADPYILDATLYNGQGVTVAASANAIPLNELLGFAGASAKYAPGDAMTYIGEVRGDDAAPVGYLRITLNHQALVATMAGPREENFDAARLMLLMAGVLGFLLALAVMRR